MRLIRADLVLTGRAGVSFAPGEVLVDGTRIAHVGPRGSAPGAHGVEAAGSEAAGSEAAGSEAAGSEAAGSEAAGSEVIELPGCTVLPGLIDAHVHLGFDRAVDPATRRSAESDAHLLLRMAENGRKLLSAGVTTARDLGGRDFLEVELRDAIETGLAVGPHLVVATRPITNTGGHCWYMGGEADTEDAIRQVARENFRAGADLLKIMATGGNMTPGSVPPWTAQFTAAQIKIAVHEAALRGRTVAAHAHGVTGIENAVDAGVTTIEHCSFQAGEVGEVPAVVDMRVVDKIAARGIYVCPTVSGVAWKLKDDLGEEWLGAWFRRLSSLRDAGVRLVAGTDSGFAARGVENRMDDYVSGLGMFALAGWPNAAVIEAATVLAAQACGIGPVTGSLDPGKRADLIGVRGNPLTSLDDLRKLQLVMVSGRQVTQAEIETVASSGGLA